MAHLDLARPAPIALAGGEGLTVTSRVVPSGAVVVAVHGEVDGTTSPLLHDRLIAHVRSTHHLIVDLSGVSFFGAAGLTVLVVVREAALSRIAGRAWSHAPGRCGCL